MTVDGSGSTAGWGRASPAHFGRTRRRLCALLEAEGFAVDALVPATGHWRTDIRVDVHRWEGKGRAMGREGLPDGTEVRFSSWSTMSQCVRLGIDVYVDDGSTNFDVCASEPA